MSLSPSSPERFEETLEQTRRNVRKLEIEAYRIRHDLTRLEAEIALGFADRETHSRVYSQPVSSAPRSSESLAANPPGALAAADRIELNEIADRTDVALTAARRLDDLPAISLAALDLPEGAAASRLQSDAQEAEELPAVEFPQAVKPTDDLATSLNPPKLRRALEQRTTRPLVASLSVHSALLLAIMSISVATIVHEDKTFTTYLTLSDKKPAENTDNLDLGQIALLDETMLDGGIGDLTEPSAFTAAKPVINDITPVDFESVAGPTSIGDLGIMQPNPTDNGAMLAGNGGAGEDGEKPPAGTGKGDKRRGARGGGGNEAGKRNGPVGSAMFFGTKSKGDRFVFVVDNSSSMKDGKLDTARAELLKTVESLSPKQSFYVIFVSDQTYPMFFPQPELELLPATPANKKRLAEWLPKAILASGKNRELIKAMDMAAALRPHAVYLLWDGDMRYSDKVRFDVLAHLTAPNQWAFTVHTLGMGITSADAEQNLTAIAAAHGGLYRRIDVPNGR